MILAFKARVHDPAIASYRYRVLEPIAFLGARGHEVEVYDEARFDQYDAVVFSKAYRPADQALASRLKAAGKRVVLDLCDDHFFNPEGLASYQEAREQLLAMIGLADKVVCSTPVLARAVQAEAGLAAAPEVAPDVYERAGVEVGPPTPQGEPARLLWFGRHGSPNAPAGMGDLMLIADHLVSAYEKRAFELVVCSNSREKFDSISAALAVPLRYVEWSPESFAAELARADAVIIPLSDNPFVAAKTHNRMSLALSAGAPVVADSLDSYLPFEPFAFIGDWKGGLEAVLLRPEEARARAGGARAFLDANWSAEALAPQWEAALGLAPAVSPRAQILAEPADPIPDVASWLMCEGRSKRTWLLAGNATTAEAVADARADDRLVMAIGEAAARIPSDLAFVVDAEVLQAHGEAIATAAGAVAVAGDLHHKGWAAGRSLESWAADLPVLRALHRACRLYRFELWTGAARGIEGELETEEIPLRVLARSGVRAAVSLGLQPPAPAVAGLEGLTSILERKGWGPAAFSAADGLDYRPLDRD